MTEPTPPTADPRPVALRRADSLVLVNTGHGKGKSTAAFGVVMRSVARGWPVAVVQFLKSGNWNVGEEKVARQLGVAWWAIGEGFTWDSHDLTKDQAVAAEAWRKAAELLAAGTYRLVVLDEITYPMNWGWIDAAAVTKAITSRSPKVNVVATGRDAPAALVSVADTATEMRSLKHAYQSGIRAMKGIDY
ncbi:MAG TPA: cob(I)yrinic acid a,c-diamide adenosyltransferase [Acidimicrobiia bacterium]|nr:cob(I)yrinic acid a,c-diamide adenosyltransferase [Acidimicrobiia bacterium]